MPQKTIDMTNCPCGSGILYKSCCKMLHTGTPAKTALELMKARYSAYVLNLPEYIIKTTHPASPQYEHNLDLWAKEITEFSTHSTFERLEILEWKERGNIAQVMFVAHLKQQEQDATFTEKSTFEKRKESWLYRSGQLYAGHAPNLLTVNEIRILPLAYYGDPILRIKAEPITQITEDLKQLIAEMKETMDACGGVGLAAPQVHHSIRLFLIRTPIETTADGFDNGDIQVYINPSLLEPSHETWKSSEGCLSIPTIHGNVERPKEITVEYMNECGKFIRRRAKGWEARIIMHEYDHLNGHFFVDRLEKEELKNSTPDLLQVYQRIHDPLAL